VRANRYKTGEFLHHHSLIECGALLVDKSEISRLQSYFRKQFRLDTITVQARPNKDDSAEVNIGDEFIGVLFKDEEEGEVSYAFNMAILDIDLPDA